MSIRATRDVLHRSHHLRHKRAEWYAHIQNTSSQYNLGKPLGRIAKPQNHRGLLQHFDHHCVQKTMALELALVDFDDPRLAAWERSREKSADGLRKSR
jgi:hypothetical protein